MPHKALLITILVLLNTWMGLSQKSLDEVSYVDIQWQVGTNKKITQVDSSIIYVDGSVYMATGVASKYTIKIVDKKDTIYEVRFQQLVMKEDVSIESNMINVSPIEELMEEMISDLQSKFGNFEYSFLVDQNTGSAFEVKNEEEIEKVLGEFVEVVIERLRKRSDVELTENEFEEMKFKINKYVDEQMPATFQTMLNAFNYLFQVYSFPFIPGETFTQDIEVSSVDQIRNSDDENNAKLVVKGKVDKSEILIDYEYVYDKEEAYQTYVVEQGKASQIPFDEFELNERIVSHIDLKSSWIKSSESRVHVKMGNVQVINTSKVLIE